MKNLFTCLLAFSTLLSFAQKKLQPGEFAKTITAADLKKHLYIVAGSEMEGRETATEGQRKAAAYIENHFKQSGLLPGNAGSYQYNFNVDQDSLVDAKLEVNNESFQLDKDFNPATNTINSTLRFSEVVFTSRNAADSLSTVDLNGKLVLVPANTSANVQIPVGLEQLY